MTYGHLQTPAYFLAAVILLLLSFRNIRWNENKEQRRVDRILSLGLAHTIRLDTIPILLIGLSLLAVGTDFRAAAAWDVIGFVLIGLWAVFMLVSIFGSFATQPIEHTLDPAICRKRVKARRISGILFLVGAIAWIYSGFGCVI